MITSYRAESNQRPAGAVHGYTTVNLSVPARGIVDSFKLKGQVTRLLREDGFSRALLTGRYQRDGVVVICQTNLLSFDATHRFELRLRSDFPSRATDALVEKIDATLQVGKGRGAFIVKATP
jgi:hypothetical protein